MLRLLLVVQDSDTYLIPIMWGFGVLLLITLIVSAIVQYRAGHKIRKELSELEKVRQDNIEYDLVLKAMKLATWHIDPQKRTVTFDADFREGSDNYYTSEETPLQLFRVVAVCVLARVALAQ